MHNYTKLRTEELKVNYIQKCEEEWQQHSESVNKAGRYGSSSHVLLVLESGFKYIDNLFEELFNSEKSALLSEQSQLPGYYIDDPNYFDNFKKETSDLLLRELNELQSKVLKHFGNLRPQIDTINSKMQEYEKMKRESVNRRIELLQEELRMGIGIPQPSIGTTIYVGGDVGVINTGQIYGSIQVNIETLKESNQAELAEAFNRLTEAIKDSDVDDKTRYEQMENVDFLITQFKVPQEKRKHGVIKAIERFLSNAANLTTIWEQVGPFIMKTLGIG
ncbi:MAG: hypothetical protein M0Z70_14530 [Nitrospiraceae bacterium]|nr:hypothetical protein [Nitrospiraceae bacterium]